MGLGITLRQPLHLQKVDDFEGTAAWSVSGTPADSVKMALSVLLTKKPDLVISGINRGSNAGQNVLYSGTVAGVIESALRGIPGIAFSCYDYFDPNYADVIKFIPHVLEHVQEHPLPHGTILNVTFPSKQHQKVKGFKMTRQGKEYWIEEPEHRIHPTDTNSYYWLGAKLVSYPDEHKDSDIAWLEKGYITAVPLHFAELTDHQHLQGRKAHFEKSFS